MARQPNRSRAGAEAYGRDVIPDWLRSLRERLDADVPEWFIEHAPPSDPHRSSAVLVLFGPDADGETSIVLTERAHDLRSHAAQVVFPGGHVDPGETPIQAALRESTEEIGLDPHTVEIVCCLPGVYLTPASTEYVPVLGWWHTPHPIDVVDPAEVRRIVIPTIADIIDARNRFTARAPGYSGPGFMVDDLIVWGVTADLLQVVLDLAGLSQPWDASISHPLPDRLLGPYAMDVPPEPPPSVSP